MPRPPQHVTDAELAVLEALWETGGATVRELADRLYDSAGNSECATVQKLCDRLQAKGCVACDNGLRPRRYRAAVDRRILIGRQLETIADRFCSGALFPLVTQLVDDGALSAEQLERLRQHIDRLDSEGPD